MDINALTERIEELPTISTVANQINAETQKKSLTAKSLSAIIAQDPALMSKILKLANSAYYGLSKQVDTLERAVTILGFNTVKSLALTISVHSFFKKGSSQSFDIKELWLHSLGCAVAAKTLASINYKKVEELAFVGGILHDIGKLAIAHFLQDEMMYIIGLLQDTEMEQSEVEMQVLGFTHQRVGRILAEKWNFPGIYVTAIKYHHGPLPSKLDDYKDVAAIVRSVYIGNQIAKTFQVGKSTDQALVKIPLPLLETLGISDEMVSDLGERIEDDFNRMLSAWKLDE